MAGKSGSKGRAAGIGSLWQRAKEEAKKSSFSEAVPVEPGKYNFQFLSAEIGDFGGKRQVMLKWCPIGDTEEVGKVCTEWLSLEEDRIVWLARKLASMGVDIDDAEVETESDLEGIFSELAEAQTVCAGKVKEKDGYTNMYTNQVVEVDSGDLLDPADVLDGEGKKDKGKADSGKKDKGKKKEEADDDEGGGDDGEDVEIDVGDRVRWKDGKKTMEGEIKSFDKNDNAVIMPDGGKVKITMELGDLEKIEEEGDGGDDEGDEGGDDEAEIEVGDVVTLKVKGKTKSGVVDKLRGDKAFVKVKGEPKPIEAALEDISLAAD